MFKVLTAYRKIEASNDKRVKNVLHTLEKSKRHHYIVETKNGNRVSPDGIPSSPKADSPVGTMTSLNLSDEEKDALGKTNNSVETDLTIVSHEMRHAYDYDIGNQKDNEDYNNSEDPSEIRAVFFSNLARQIDKQMKMRTKYAGEEIDPKKLVNPPNNKFPEEIK
jgi:hypothetical protein